MSQPNSNDLNPSLTTLLRLGELHTYHWLLLRKTYTIVFPNGIYIRLALLMQQVACQSFIVGGQMEDLILYEMKNYITILTFIICLSVFVCLRITVGGGNFYTKFYVPSTKPTQGWSTCFKDSKKVFYEILANRAWKVASTVNSAQFWWIGQNWQELAVLPSTALPCPIC